MNSILKELQVSIFWVFSIKTAKGEANLQFSISMVVEGEGQVPKLLFFWGLAIFKYMKYFTSLVMEMKNQSEMTFLFWENTLGKQKLQLVVALILSLKQTVIETTLWNKLFLFNYLQ